MRFVRSRLNDTGLEDAEDILQDVFLEAMGRGHADEADHVQVFEDLEDSFQSSFEDRFEDSIEDLTAWMFAVTRHKIVDRWRRKSRSPPMETIDLETLLADSGIDVERGYLNEDLLRRVNAAIEELPSEQRAAFIGQSIEGRTFRELSEASGEPVNTWIARKRYAVEYLRRRLRDLQDDA